MGSPVKILPLYTYTNKEQWEGKWEQIENIPYAMSPSFVPEHQCIAFNLTSLFHGQLKECRNCTVCQPIYYRIADDTIDLDMLVVRQEIKEKYLDFPPTLVAEILSHSPLLKDRHSKFYLYESQKVKYYLIIGTHDPTIEISRWNGAAYQL
ncbi:Uma2 family endonuclease [Pollutibacter soli]|uniref:Uma2 family endonuclease n=1 Tax=Pollutibacter soli TaxID=3034157 RepID=UPI0030132864